MALRSKTQRSLLLGFIGSIAACGLVGIYCLAVGTIGKLEAKILLTTTAVGVSSILALAAAVPWERRRWHPIGPIGVMTVTIGLVYSLVMIWIVAEMADADIEVWLKGYGVVCVVAVAIPLLGLISMAQLRRQWAFVRVGTVVVVIVFACQIIVSIIYEIDDDVWYRIMGILGIAVACGNISLPILHRVSRMQTREAVQTVELALNIVCPRCGKQQTLPVGRSTCSGCALRFLIEIEEDTCRTCGYLLYQIESAVCPECGTPIERAGAGATATAEADVSAEV